MSETTLPPAGELIAAARDAMRHVRAYPREDAAGAAGRRRRAANKALDRWAPEIDQLTDIAGAAEFLGLASQHSLRRNRWRTREDGTPGWPEPDQTFGRVPTWKLRTIVLHRAESPGHGHPGYTGRRTRKGRAPASA